jgi:hypothetical protein
LENTTYYRDMMNLSKNDNTTSLGQFGKVKPPTILQVASQYKGPIVFVSNYDRGKEEPAKEIIRAMDDLIHTRTRTNIRGILSRKYIPFLKNNECGTDDKKGVAQCGIRRAASHRCVGKHGGHPDLIAFDIQDELYSLLA